MINEEFLLDIKNGKSLYHLVEISMKNQTLFFSSSDFDIEITNNNEVVKYQSGHLLNHITLDNIDNNNGILLRILQSEDINIEELLQAKITIKLTTISNTITIFRGFVGNVLIENNVINATIFSNLARLKYSIGQLYSPVCRECIGSENCGINIDDYKANGVVESIISADCITGNHQTNKATEIGYYKYGIIKFLTGKLQGISMQIKDELDGKIYLLQNTKLISVGDEYELFAGCDKTLKTCKEKFDNVMNFRGEPYINKEVKN